MKDENMDKVTFITNIRYGELPVRKVYLGDKLIWQCIKFQGELEMYLKSEGMLSERNSIPSKGDINNNFYTNTKSKIFDSILSDGKLSLSLKNDSNTNSFDSILSDGKLKLYLMNNNFNGNSFDSILSDGKLSLSLKTFFNGDAFQEILSDGKLKLYLVNNNFNGNSFDSILSDGKLKMCFKDNIEGDSFTANLLKSSLNFILDNVVNISNIPTATFLNGVLNFGFATKKNFVSSNKADLVESYKKEQDINFSTKSTAIFWYPPLGDDIPLFIEDEVDISQNRDILEIQQAYEIIIDSKNKILEVI